MGDLLSRHDERLKNIEKFMETDAEWKEKMEDKLDALVAFKWQVLGGAAVLSSAISMASHYLKK